MGLEYKIYGLEMANVIPSPSYIPLNENEKENLSGTTFGSLITKDLKRYEFSLLGVATYQSTVTEVFHGLNIYNSIQNYPDQENKITKIDYFVCRENSRSPNAFTKFFTQTMGEPNSFTLHDALPPFLNSGFSCLIADLFTMLNFQEKRNNVRNEEAVPSSIAGKVIDLSQQLFLNKDHRKKYPGLEGLIGCIMLVFSRGKNPELDLRMGEYYYYRSHCFPDYKRAFMLQEHIWNVASNRTCQYFGILGKCYKKGRYTDQNLKKAFKVFKHNFMNLDSTGLSSYLSLYRKNYSEAISLRTWSDLKRNFDFYSQAMETFSIEDDCVKKEILKGFEELEIEKIPAENKFKFLKLGAKAGSAKAKEALLKLYIEERKKLSPEQDLNSFDKRFSILPLARKNYALGLIDSHPSFAFEELHEAALEGAKDLAALKSCYLTCLARTNNPSDKRKLHQLMSMHNDAEALNNLAINLCLTDYLTREIISEAISNFEKSAALGNSWAMVNLGLIYENGLLMEGDSTKAFEWYKKALDQGNSICRDAYNWLKVDKALETGQRISLDLDIKTNKIKNFLHGDEAQLCTPLTPSLIGNSPTFSDGDSDLTKRIQRQGMTPPSTAKRRKLQ